MRELYLFNDNGTAYAFVAEVLPVTFGTNTYVPTVITRNALNITDNFEKSDMEFQFERGHSYALNLLQTIPEKPITVIVYRNNIPYWHGIVKEAKTAGKTINIVCNSLDSNLTHAGLRARMTLQCRKVLYSEDCGVIKALWGSTFSTTANSSDLIISGMSNPSGYYSGGIAEMGGQSRHIINHIDSIISITHPFTGILSGAIVLYPGCQLTKAACTAFGNLDNGGMFADIPSKNPFSVNGLL
jgi:hypothetical protein